MKSKLKIVFWTILLCSSCNSSQLEEREQNIELSYIAWGCDCANWATSGDIHKYSDEGDSLSLLSVFIEPADSSVALPDSDWNGDVIRFTGRFYKEKGFPKGFKSDEPVDEARVFRYTSYKVIKRK